MILNSKIHRVFFYLLIVLLPTQLGLHFWPDWALVLGRRVDYLSPTLYLTDILIILMLASWMWKSIFRMRQKELKIKKQRTPFILYSLFFILLLFVSANIWFSLSRVVAIYHWIKFVELSLLGYYIVKTKPNFIRVTGLLSFAVLYSSLLSIAQFTLQHSVGGIFWFLGERTFTEASPGIAKIALCLPYLTGCPLVMRPYATFPHPNVLGGLLATVLPLLIIQYSNNPIIQSIRKMKLLYLTTIVFGIIALILTFSRAAWVVGIFGMFMVHRSWFMGKKNISLIIIIACVFVLLLLPFFSQLTADSESVVVRQQLNASAIHMWESSPLFGVGLGNFLVALPDFLPSRGIYFLQPVHNIYLLVLSEVGIVGSALIGYSIWALLRRHRTRNKSIFHISCLMSLVSLLLLGLVDHYPLSLQQGQLLFTLLIGLNLMVQ